MIPDHHRNPAPEPAAIRFPVYDMSCFSSTISLGMLAGVMTDTDENLMLRYQEGDAGAFEILYKRHKDGLYRYFLRQCGHASSAEELFQDVWMSLIRHVKRYSVQAKFTTYLYHLAHNRLIDHYRKHSKGIPVSYEDCVEEGFDPAIAEPGNNPESVTSQEQQHDCLMRSIRELPEAQREAFLLREETGLSIEEIANITGVNAETAKSRLRYAVKKLRESMRGLR